MMHKVNPDVTVEMLQAFADAWNRHDVDAIMTFMTDDCVFESWLPALTSAEKFMAVISSPCATAKLR